MDKILVQKIIILSLIVGLILGLLAPVPVVGMIMLFSVLLLASPIVILYMILAGELDLTSPKDSIITGAIIGFSANLTFAVLYSILMVLLAKVFHFTPNFFLTAMITNSPIWLIGTFIIFLGVLCATTNSFTGFATYYIINFIRDVYEKKHPQIQGTQDFTQENYK